MPGFAGVPQGVAVIPRIGFSDKGIPIIGRSMLVIAPRQAGFVSPTASTPIA
jgi:hypothetical protein